MVFGGTFTAGGLRVACQDGQLRIMQEGAHQKFVSQLQQVSYSGPYASQRGQVTLFVTERAVFQVKDGELELIEIAPGIDLERDILQQMRFRPRIAAELKLMDTRLFSPEPMGLSAEMAAKPRSCHPRLASLSSKVQP